MWAMRVLVLLTLPWACYSDGSPTGMTTCPCVEWVNLNNYQVSNVIRYTPKGQSTGYDYPLNYGNLQCQAHDSGLAPFCDGTSPPAWCTQKWCYVDKSTCTGVVAYKSFLFENSDAYYSYQTCGSSNEFESWTTSVSAGEKTPNSVTELLDVVQGYLWSTRERVETEHSALTSTDCTWIDQCNCLECIQSSLWNRKVDFSNVGVNAKDARFGCLSRPVSQSYINIAAKEAEPLERVGYIYFSDHATGSYLGWPAVDWCPESNYDPRLRPWYSSGSTGPKDLVIVVDVSGSMITAGRSRLAKAATAAVIDTLEWKDYATIILFNNAISAQYSQQLVPMFDEERTKAKTWLNSQSWEMGGTNFKTALDAAFNAISRSVSAGTTSMCQKAILFLTDGQADFTESDFASIQSRSQEFSVALFTYALGSGADTTITRRLACENSGIFYPLADGADLSTAMSKYYEYFASGVEICTPSFTRYQDVVTGAELWPACLPSYNRSSGEQGLLGVSCLDLNLMIDMSTIKSADYFSNFVCKLSDLTKQCRQLDMNDCRLEKLRRAVDPQSSCIDMTLDATCPCADPTCQDNEDFLDEKNYFCDTWVGDDCSKAASDWGYSASGQEQVLAQCRRSCGRCPVGTCPQQAQCQNGALISDSTCRSQRTHKVTPNNIQNVDPSATTTSGQDSSTFSNVGGANSAGPAGPQWICLYMFVGSWLV